MRRGDVMGTRVVPVGSQELDLPVVLIAPGVAITLLMTIDLGVDVVARAAQELARLLTDAKPEMVVAPATLGIPVAIEVSRALGLDDYVILQKTPKHHLAGALSEPVTSVTTGPPQQLLLDRRRAGVLRGRRVALVDDVVSTGASMRAALRLVRRAGGQVVAIGALLQESDRWRTGLGEDRALLQTLGAMPLLNVTEGRIDPQPG
jgi:adenine/guanine phosphoribosyltransferase-like PRPP-binding protein